MADYGVGASDEIARLSLGHEPDEKPPAPPPLDAAGPGIVAVDITERFAAAARTLSPGEVVKDAFFTLFESVSALEMMDPKMDSGCVEPGDEFEELYDVSRPLLPEEVLGIMDQLLCHEMSWHLGYPLSQTVLTSVYVEALLVPCPASTELAQFVRDDGCGAKQQPMLRVLRAYCLAMIKACGYVNERIKSEHFYEEEDFVTNTYHRTLLTNLPTHDIRLALTEAADLAESLRHSLGQPLADALVSRLRLRRIFLDAAECLQHVKDAARARAPWDEALSVLPAIRATHCLAEPVDEAFSTKLQRKLASTMPPRPIVQLGFDDAFGHLTRLFADGSEVIGVLDYVDSQCLLTFVLSFQSKKPQPLVYVRTLLQTFLFNAMEMLGSMSIRQLLDDDLSIVSLPASPLLDRDNDEVEAVHDARYAMAQQMERFRQRAAQPFLDILRTACQNRSRVRRTLCHTMRDWEGLQVETDEMDQVLQAKTRERPLVQQPALGEAPVESFAMPLSSWAYLYKLRQMEWVVQLGFELELYQDDEMAGMYWYLNHLARARLQHAERIKGFVVRRVEEARSQPPRRGNGNGNGGGGGGGGGVDEQLQRSLAHARLALLDAAATWELSDALCCLYAVAGRMGLVVTAPRPYSDDELRYELRMKPFAAVGFPELPGFDDFCEGVAQRESTSQELLEYAGKAAAGARKGLEALSRLSPAESFSVGCHDRWAASARGALRSSIAAGIAIASLQKALGARGAAAEVGGGGGDWAVGVEVPRPDEAYHEWWIVPRIVTAA